LGTSISIQPTWKEIWKLPTAPSVSKSNPSFGNLTGDMIFN